MGVSEGTPSSLPRTVYYPRRYALHMLHDVHAVHVLLHMLIL